jgi:osmotically-inducible protein OsmY
VTFGTLSRGLAVGIKYITAHTGETGTHILLAWRPGVLALGCASTAKQAGAGEYVDDTVITTKVKVAILNEPALKSAEINVETFKGVVQLSGFASSSAAESKAVEVARTVGGVKSVNNDMRLK